MVDLAEGFEELRVVEVAFVERMNQAAGSGIGAELGAADGHGKDPAGLVAKYWLVVLGAV